MNKIVWGILKLKAKRTICNHSDHGVGHKIASGLVKEHGTNNRCAEDEAECPLRPGRQREVALR